MKKRCQLLLLISIICLSILTQFSPMTASAISWTGDYIVPAGTTREIKNDTLDIDGNIVVEKGALLSLTNTTINIIGKDRKVTFKSSRLEGQNATISSSRPYNVFFESATVAATKLDIKSATSATIYFRGSTMAELSLFNFVKTSPYPISAVKVEGSSVVSISNATIMEPPTRVTAVLVKDSATLSVTDSIIYDVEAMDDSQISLTRSGILWSLSVEDSSKITVLDTYKAWFERKVASFSKGVLTTKSSTVMINNTIMRKATAYDSSTISIFNTTLQDGAINSYNSSVISLSKIRMRGTSVPPKVLAYGDSKITITDSEIRDISSVGAYDSSGVTILRTKLRDLVAQNNSVVTVSDSEASGLSHISGSSSASFLNCKLEMLHVFESSTVSVSNSQIKQLESYESSVTSVSNSQVTLLRSSESSEVSLSDSTVKEIFLYFNSVNASFSNLNPAHFESWSSLEGSAVGTGGYAPHVSLTETTVQLGWGFWFLGTSNVTISDSTIESIGLSDSSSVRLINSMLVSDPAVLAEGLINLYWYLEVQSVEGAEVSVWYSNGTLVESQVAGSNGLTTFTLLEKSVEASNINTLGDYIVKASWDASSREATTKLTGTKKLVLTPPLPWWQEYWYLILLVAVFAIVSVAIFIRRKSSKKFP